MKLTEYSLQKCQTNYIQSLGQCASSNEEIGVTIAPNKAQACAQFRVRRPDLRLDDKGYAKHGDITYCVCEPYSSHQ